MKLRSVHVFLANGCTGRGIDYVYKHHTVVNYHIIPLMMEAKGVSEMLDFCPELTRLVAREDFIVSKNSFETSHKEAA
jgi:hypothetical protein